MISRKFCILIFVKFRKFIRKGHLFYVKNLTEDNLILWYSVVYCQLYDADVIPVICGFVL